MDQATLNVIMALGIALSFAATTFVFLRTHPNATPQQLDENTSARLAELQLHRDFMTRLEQAYQQQNTVFQGAFDTVTALVKTIAPLTPIKTDDELGKFLDDVKEPGDPMPPKLGASG